ncbi:hypothetical protein V5799_001097 [Amblyomma americanum]|uniref:Uncharacterized protein n=1 Tax=Amblyomma americanum TaxID=6943 RepID=A0AAQ4D162_AMBAM
MPPRAAADSAPVVGNLPTRLGKREEKIERRNAGNKEPRSAPQMLDRKELKAVYKHRKAATKRYADVARRRNCSDVNAASSFWVALFFVQTRSPRRFTEGLSRGETESRLRVFDLSEPSRKTAWATTASGLFRRDASPPAMRS